MSQTPSCSLTTELRTWPDGSEQAALLCSFPGHTTLGPNCLAVSDACQVGEKCLAVWNALKEETTQPPSPTPDDPTPKPTSADPSASKEPQTSTGLKHDAGKLRYDLLPPEALARTAEVFTFGAAKYGDRNWELGISAGRFFAAAQRHMWAVQGGEYLDPESGVPHYAHAIASLMMSLSLMERERKTKGGTALG